MKKYFLISFFTCLALILPSCSSVVIQSNKLASYTKHPQKVFILINSSDEHTYFDVLSKDLQKKFTEHGIKSAIFLQDELSLETKEDIEKKIDAYNPEVVLRIEETTPGPESGNYQLTLVDQERKNIFWKGIMHIMLGQYKNKYELLPETATEIINKLIADKII